MTIPIVLFVFVSFFKSVLNGYRAIGYLSITTVFNSAIIALLSYPVSEYINKGYNYAFVIMMIVSSSLTLLLALIYLHRGGWLSSIFYGWILHNWSIKHFLILALSMMITGIVNSSTLLLIKGWIIQQMDMSSVGIFDVSWTISMVYIGLITKSFSAYYLPSLSEIHDTKKKTFFIRQVFRLVVIILVPAVVFLIVFKRSIINILYSNDFNQASLILRWMLIGDYFKVSSWVLTFPMIAYGDIKMFISSGLIWWMFFGMSSYSTIFFYNSLEGVGVIYLVLYVIYLIFSVIYLYKYHHFTFSLNIIIQWSIGLCIVIGASFTSWSNYAYSGILILLWSAIILTFTYFSITSEEKRKVLKYLHNKKGKKHE